MLAENRVKYISRVEYEMRLKDRGEHDIFRGLRVS